MAESLNLPSEVKPLWIEGLFTSEYERDTLPLLFASDKVYQDYYAALKVKNPSLAIAIEQIQERNTLARMERQEGMWMECVDSLLYCANLRKAVFADTDFQYIAAQKHHIMSVLNFATFFLRESANAKTREAMLMRSYELFKKAEEAVAHVRGREDRYFLKAAVENNYSVYFAKRKRYCAAAQRIQMALRAWLPLNLNEHQFYFAVQKGSGDLWSGRVEDAILGLKQATLLVSKKKLESASSPPRGRGDHELSDASSSSDDEAPVRRAKRVTTTNTEAAHAPFRYKIHVLNGGLDDTTAACIAMNHNLAVALIAQRRYKEAIAWVTRSLEITAANSSQLSMKHPIVVAVRHAEEFCHKMASGTKINAFRMKLDDHSSEQYRAKQAAVREVQSASGRAASDHPSHTNSPARGHSSQGSRFRKPSQVEALQTYLKNISYRQLVEEYGFEAPRKVSPHPAKGKGSPPRPPKGHDDHHHESEDEGAATPATSSRKSTPSRRAPSTPRTSSPESTPRKRDASPAREKTPPRAEQTNATTFQSPENASPGPTPRKSTPGSDVASPQTPQDAPAPVNDPVPTPPATEASAPPVEPPPPRQDGPTYDDEFEEASPPRPPPPREVDTPVSTANAQPPSSNADNASTAPQTMAAHDENDAAAQLQPVDGAPKITTVAAPQESNATNDATPLPQPPGNHDDDANQASGYGDDTFEAVSETASPERQGEHRSDEDVANSTSNTTAVVNVTGDDSTFSPLAPRDAPSSVEEAANAAPSTDSVDAKESAAADAPPPPTEDSAYADDGFESA